MTHLPFNLLDASVVTVLLISAASAFFRGFIGELLALGAWVGAGILTLYLFPHSVNVLRHYIKSEHIAAGVAALGTYIGALMLMGFLNSVIMRYVKKGKDVGVYDNMLGLFFGLARGVFILSLGFLLTRAFVDQENPPEWLKGAKTRYALQSSADLLMSLSPQYLTKLEIAVEKEAEHEKELRAQDAGGSVDAPKDKDSATDYLNFFRSKPDGGVQTPASTPSSAIPPSDGPPYADSVSGFQQAAPVPPVDARDIPARASTYKADTKNDLRQLLESTQPPADGGSDTHDAQPTPY